MHQVIVKDLLLKGLLPLALISSVFADYDDSKNNRFSILGEVVLMHRSGGQNDDYAINTAITAPSNDVVLTNKHLTHRFEYEPGFRVGFEAVIDDYKSLNGNFLWIAQWDASKTVGADGTLQFPFAETDFTVDYVNADVAKATYKTNFYSAEVNYVAAVTPRFSNYFGFVGMFGLRYMSLREHFNLAYTKAAATSNYKIDTQNALIGAQAGADLQWNPTTALSWDFFLKLGGFVNLAEQKTFLGDVNNTVTLRNYKSNNSRAAMMIEGGLTLSYQVLSFMNFHGGYQFIYLAGMALAPDQIDDNTTPVDTSRLKANGDPLIQGAYIGLIFGF